MPRLKPNRRDISAWCTCRLHGQRGGTLLITVLGLSLATLAGLMYASRSLVSEQRSSLLQWRTAQAAQAADAGLDWALAALNSGRLSPQCQPSSDSTATPLGPWWLRVDPTTHRVQPVAANNAPTAPRPGCAVQDNGWACHCPGTSSAWSELDQNKAAFEVHLQASPAVNTVMLQSVGCSPGHAACLRTGVALAPEAAASVSMVAGRMAHLRVQPNAAVTVAQSLNASPPSGLVWSVTTTASPSSSAAIRAGGAIEGLLSSVQALRADGSPAPVVSQDPWLAALAGKAPDRRFAMWMGVAPSVFQRYTSVVTLQCPAQGCADALSSVVSQRPGGTVWVRGTLRLERPITLGSPQEPVLIVAEEGVVLEPPGSQIVGVVVLPALQLLPATPSPFVAGLGSIQGAMVSLGALGGLSGQAWPSVRFDPEVISRVLTDHGEWVRVPGGWRDY